MMLKILLFPILIFLHLIYDSYVFVKYQCIYYQRELINLIYPTNLNNINLNNDKIKKLPEHLVFIVGCEDISFVDLIKMICWSVALGIPYLSFYDYKGIIKKSCSLLKEHIEKLNPSLRDKVVWIDESSTKSSLNTNGFRKSITKVQLLSYEDGKGEIVNLTKELSTAVKLNLLKTDDINEILLNEKLHINHIPDPDVAIVSGNTFTTFGLLPWHIRLTEFFNIPTHHNLIPNDLLKVLEKYQKCEQRYGK